MVNLEILLSFIKKSNSCDLPKLSPVTLIVDPTFGFSGIILNTEFSNIPPSETISFDFVTGLELATGFGNSLAIVFPISICWSFLSSAFQFTPEDIVSVLIPIFIDSPGLITSDDEVNIMTP